MCVTVAMVSLGLGETEGESLVEVVVNER